MSLDKNSIDKEISMLGVEAVMFQELPKVKNALHSMCKHWFFSDCRAFNKTMLDLTTSSQDTPTSILAIEPSDDILLLPQKKKSNVLNWVLLKN